MRHDGTGTRIASLTLFLGLWSALAASPATSQESAETRLQAAIYKQQVEGDVRGAIELLRRIASESAADRAVAARALLQLGLAHETLGTGDAEATYRRLLRDYPDQADAASTARKRLAVLAPPTIPGTADGLTARLLWVNECCVIRPGAISPDGDELAMVDWGLLIEGDNTGDLIVVEPYSDEARTVGRTGGQAEDGDTYVLRSVWSSDGSRLAFATWPPGWGRMALRVVDEDGQNDRVVSDNPQHVHLRPGAWTSDQRLVVSLIQGWDDVVRLGTIAVDDGSVTVLKTLRDGVDINDMSLSLSPDDRFLAYSYTPTPGDPAEVHVIAMDGSGEWVVGPSAAEERNPHWTPDGERLVFLSDRSGTTGLWAVEMRDGRATGEPELVHPHTGPIVLLGFTADGTLAYGSQVPDNKLRVATIDWDDGRMVGEDAPLTERFLGYNHYPTWSPDGQKVAYISTRPGPGIGGSNVLVIRSMDDGTERDIQLTMPLGREGELRAVRPAWSRDSRYVLLAAYAADGTGTTTDLRRASYRIDVESGAVEREPYIRDYAGLARGSQQRFVDERQSETLRSLGVRISGQWDHQAYRRDGEPLRPGESLLLVASGIRWWRDFDCDDAGSHPEMVCGGNGLMEPVTPNRQMKWELSPDGTTIAFVLEDPDAPRADLWIWPISTDREPKLVVGGLEGTSPVRWTPDGRHLLYWQQTESGGDGGPGRVFRVPSEGGEPELLDLSLTQLQLVQMTFEPGGQRVIMGDGNEAQRHEIWLLSGFPWDGRD